MLFPLSVRGSAKVRRLWARDLQRALAAMVLDSPPPLVVRKKGARWSLDFAYRVGQEKE